MASARKKLDEKHLKILRELVSQPGNKHCFDCNQRGPTYVNITIGSFVCTSCSGLLRGINPPHRVKSISMATYTPEEIEFMRCRGNEYCRKVWLGLCDSEQLTKDEQQIKDFMIAKYERKRYYLEPAESKKIMTNGSCSPKVSPPKTTLPPSTSLNFKSLLPNSQTSSVSLNHISNLSIPRAHSEIKASNSFNTQTTISSQPEAAGFANFDNNPVFSNPPATVPTASGGSDSLRDLSGLDFNTRPCNSIHVPPFSVWSGNNVTSWDYYKSSWGYHLPSSVLPTNRWSIGVINDKPAFPPPPSEDRYAALKDLDCLMKSQMASEKPSTDSNLSQTWGVNNSWNGSSVFETSSTVPDNNGTSNPFAVETDWNLPNTFVGNPFKSSGNDTSWPLINGQVTNGFPTSQSLHFGSGMAGVTSNPFNATVKNSVQNNHHSSNPFL